MNVTFTLSEYRTVEASFSDTIDMFVVDSRVPLNTFQDYFLTLEEYNERIEFLKEHDHIFGMNMVKERYYRPKSSIPKK